MFLLDLCFLYTAPAAYYLRQSGYPVLYSNVNCRGFENNLSKCYKLQYPSFTCFSFYSIAGVRCFDGMLPLIQLAHNIILSIIDCSEGDIRLVGGPSDSEGTVEICHNNLWGLVNDLNWGNAGAMVACRQLGLPTQS